MPSAGAAPERKSKRAGELLAGRYIVVYEQAVRNPNAETERQERARGFRARFRYDRAVKGFAAKLSPGQVAQLRADPDVAYVARDRLLSARRAVSLASGDFAPTGVRRMHAASTTRARQASDAGVAVLDTGIDLSHPDLNAVHGKNCVVEGAPAEDDDLIFGHGTHVAGTIGAENNGSGVVGVAPGTRLHAVKVLDGTTESGLESQIICGLEWVRDNAEGLDIEAANMSLGGRGGDDSRCVPGETHPDPMHQAVCEVTRGGTSVVAAAGNDGSDLGDPNVDLDDDGFADGPETPAAYPEVLTVTAMADSDGRGGGAGADPGCDTSERDDHYARFSNYATRRDDIEHVIAAPGVCIDSTAPGGDHRTLSGTSMAAPHVSGAVALCAGEGGASGPCAGRSPAEIIDHLRADAAANTRADPPYGFAGDPLRPNDWGDYFGHLVRADTAPPGTAISAGPSGVTRSTFAELRFGATEAGGSFECRLDSGAWQACSSPSSYAGIGNGTHAFSVRARDGTGILDLSAATRSWTVDTQPPSTAITAGPSSPTRDRTPTFRLAAGESGARFQCRVDAGAWQVCGSTHTTPALARGTHTFAARAIDVAGNVDGTPAVRSFRIDIFAPSIRTAVPRRALPTVLRRGFRARVRVSEASRVSVALVLSGRTARRLGLSRGRAVVVGRASTSFLSGGRKTVAVKLTRRARRRLARVRSVRLYFPVRATDRAGNSRRVSRRVTLRR